MKEPSDSAARAIAMLLVPLALLYFSSCYHWTYPKYTLLQTACLVLFLLVLRRHLDGARVPALGWVEAGMGAWVGLCFVSCLWARSPRASLYMAVGAAFYVAWAVLVGLSSESERSRRTLVWGIVVAGGVVAALGLLLYFWGWITHPELRRDPTFRLALPWRGNANFTAALLLTPLVFCGIRVMRDAERRRVWIGATALLCVALLLTRSASAWVGLAGAAVVVGLLLTRGRTRRLIALVPLVPALILAVVLVVPGGAAWLTDLAMKGTNVVRFYLWRDALQMFMSRPLLGWGAGNFIAVYPAFRSPDEAKWKLLRSIGNHSHNEVLETAVDLGLIGLILWGAILWLLLRRAARGTQQSEFEFLVPVAAGFCGMLVQGCFYVGLRFWDVAPFFWTHVGLLLAFAGRECARPRTPWNRERAQIALGCSAILAGLVWWRVCAPDLRAQAELARGYRSYCARKYDRAVVWLWAAAGHTWYFPDRINALSYFGLALGNKGDFEGAIAAFETVRAEAGNVGDNAYYLARLYYAIARQRGTSEEARADLERAARSILDYVSANASSKGHVLAAKILAAAPEGTVEDVKRHLEQALILDPDNAEARRMLDGLRE